MEKPVLVVLAAGMGSRYGGLKQMDPVGPCGQSILDYSVYDARRAGFETVIFILKKEMESDFRQLAGDRISRKLNVHYAFQALDDLPAGYTVPAGRTKPWGTTHAVLAARELISGPFAVINADDYYGPDAFRTIFSYFYSHTGEPDRCPYAAMGYRLGNTVTEYGSVARGVCRVDEDGFLLDIVERTCIEKDGPDARFSTDGGAHWHHLPSSTPVSMNFWGFQQSFLEEADQRFPYFLDRILEQDPERGEIYLPLLVEDILERKRARVRVLFCGEKWYGVTYREDRPSVVNALREKTAAGQYPEDLWA